MHHFKKVLYLIVFIGFSCAQAGSYDDFFKAIQLDDAKTITALLRRGFDPNSVDPSGQHGLLLAIKSGALGAAIALIEAPETRVEVRTPQDESPLMLAALKGHVELCKRLMARGADINKPGWTPLHYAATGGHAEVMQLLLEHYAYIDAASPNASTPLMMAAMYGNANAVKLLLDAGADPTLKNALGLTALDFAQKAHREDSAALIRKAMPSPR